MARTGFPGEVEHFVAYAGSAAIATVGYGLNRSATDSVRKVLQIGLSANP
jgi:hypothetical protein